MKLQNKILILLATSTIATGAMASIHGGHMVSTNDTSLTSSANGFDQPLWFSNNSSVTVTETTWFADGTSDVETLPSGAAYHYDQMAASAWYNPSTNTPLYAQVIRTSDGAVIYPTQVVPHTAGSSQPAVVNIADSNTMVNGAKAKQIVTVK